MTLGMGVGIQLASGDGLAQPLYFLGLFGGPPLLQQAHFWPKYLVFPSVESCFASGECQQVLTLPIPSAACPLSTLGGFSRRTPRPLSVHLSIQAHMVEIWAIS